MLESSTIHIPCSPVGRTCILAYFVLVWSCIHTDQCHPVYGMVTLSLCSAVQTMELELFRELGEYAEAGHRATQLAMDEAVRSSECGRIPISGAAVQREPSGQLVTVCVGCNGRIPEVGLSLSLILSSNLSLSLSLTSNLNSNLSLSLR